MLRVTAKIFTKVLLCIARWSHRGALDLKELESVLFIELTNLGDVLAMLPAVSTFRSGYPGCRLSVAVDARYARLFDSLPMVNRVIALEGTATLRGFMRARKRLAEEPYDLACSMSPSSRNSILTLGTASNAKIGYFSTSGMKTPFLSKTALSSVGCKTAGGVYFMENIYDRAQKICTSLGLSHRGDVSWNIDYERSPSGPRIVIHPFAGWSFRRWPLERFRAAAGEISRRENASVVFIGTGNELRALEGAAGEHLSLRDTTDMGDLIRLLHGADLFIGNDSGPLHLAGLLGTPVIGLYGPAPPALTGLLRDHCTYLHHRLECCPCDQSSCVRPEDPCMNQISPDELLEAVHKKLSEPRPRGPR